MSDYLANTPAEIQSRCPGCYPDEDPTTFVTLWCDAHTPSRRGVDDGAVDQYGYPISTAEAGGQDNRLWCEALHRRKRLVTGG